MLNSEIEKIFDLLDNWRLLPAYQLERRVDIFFALYLKQVLESKLGVQVQKILPEFPIHKKTLNKESTNRSFKMDYFVLCTNKVLFVELKTDLTSINDPQLKYLLEAQAVGLPALVSGVLMIHQATKNAAYKKKYEYLLAELVEAKLLGKQDKMWKNVASNLPIDIVYIQPSSGKTEGEKTVITFQDYSTVLNALNQPIATRFAKSLERWDENQSSISCSKTPKPNKA